jgi:hypothetical protein
VKRIIGFGSWRTGMSWVALALFGLAFGCGTTGGGGQCDGADSSGMCATIDNIVPTDLVSGFGPTSSVDAFRLVSGDCDANGTADDPEPFGDHSALVTISANLIPNVTSPPAPEYVEFTGYTIEYIASPTNLIAAPPLATQVFSESWKVGADETVTKTLEFVSLQTKAEFFTAFGGVAPVAPIHYTAVYTISGKTQFDQDMTLVGSTAFSIGDFDACP